MEPLAITYWRRRVDWPLMMAVGVLLIIGLATVFSAVSPLGSPLRYMTKQLLAVALGCTGFFFLTGLNYQLFRGHPRFLYGLTLVMLGGVLLLGKRVHGAKSWMMLGPLSFEPVEFAKIGFVLVLASWLDKRETEISTFKLLGVTFALAAGHALLILKEPYLGGTLVYMPVVLGMLFFAGARPLYLFALIFYAAVAAGVPMISIYFSVQPQLLDLHPVLQFLVASTQQLRTALEFLFLSTSGIFAVWWFFKKLQFRIPWYHALLLSGIVAFGVCSAHWSQRLIKDYQRRRIVVFFSPNFDPLGAGYNLMQSEIAIGSGRFFGKGLFSGSQTRLGFLPEEHTDFIFAVIGEELGFLGASVVLGAFAVLVWRAFVIATESPDRYGTLVAAGIGCAMASECLINIGMVLGLLPVAGVALPFLSYGGSHIVSSLGAVGILQSINFRRYIY